MTEKVITAKLLLPVKTERQRKKWPGKIWQQIRKTLGCLLIQPPSLLPPESASPVTSLIYREFDNIARCNKFRSEETEITITHRVLSASESSTALTLTHQKQQVCQVKLKTTWSDAGVTILISKKLFKFKQYLRAVILWRLHWPTVCAQFPPGV